jgi:signal transduction histidine kinase
MSALTASIGHELGQPLTAVLHNAQALRMMITADRATPEEIGEALADLQSEAMLATQIIDRHRAMLRSRELDKKPIDLRSVIAGSLALLAHEIRARQVEATIDLPATPCSIDGDQVLLQQVLVNLVRNAIDAMAERPPGKRRITIRSVCTGAEAELSVQDSGTGLSPEVMGTLFTPFVTTKSHGLGIGLTITRSIVEAHGGTIAARGNLDGGATFTVTLPCRRAHGLGGPTDDAVAAS